MFNLGMQPTQQQPMAQDPAALGLPPGMQGDPDIAKRMLLAQMLAQPSGGQPQRPGMQAPGTGALQGASQVLQRLPQMVRMQQLMQQARPPMPPAVPPTGGAGGVPQVPMG